MENIARLLTSSGLDAADARGLRELKKESAPLIADADARIYRRSLRLQ